MLRLSPVGAHLIQLIPHVREQQSFNYYAGTVNRKEKYFIDLGTESAGLGFTGLAKIVEIEKRIVFKGANQSINQWSHFKTEPELPCQNCLSHLMPQTLGVLKHNHWTGPKATFCVPKNCVQKEKEKANCYHATNRQDGGT